jgi:hypothetical protein
MELFFCFSCNLNAILLAPNYDKPIDTACQVLQHGLVKIPHKKVMKKYQCGGAASFLCVAVTVCDLFYNQLTVC